jgi:hypothetical protein
VSETPSILVPYVLEPAVRAAGEDYASFLDLLSEPDIQECDVRVPWWGGRLIRVRGLSATDEAAVERAGRLGAAAWRKAHADDASPPDTDWAAEWAEVLSLGVISPRLSRAQADELLKKNARGIDELVRFIRILNRLNYDAIRAHAEARADARTPEPSQPE